MFAIIAEADLIKEIEHLLERHQWIRCNESDPSQKYELIYGLVSKKVFNTSEIIIGGQLYHHHSELIRDNPITVAGEIIDGTSILFSIPAQKCESYEEALAYLCEVSLLQ